jgi:hypothetical protein
MNFWVLQLESHESIIDYKHPIIASGATPIGSAKRAPDKENIRKDCFCMNSIARWIRIFEPILEYKYSTIALGATPIGTTDRAPDVENHRLLQSKGVKFDSIYEWQTPDNTLGVLLPSREIYKKKEEPDNFGYYNNQTRLSKNTFLDRVHRDNMSECRGRKDHEGKTSGSVLHGLVFTRECALLVLFLYPCYEKKSWWTRWVP